MNDTEKSVLNDLINEFDNERKDFYNTLAADDEHAWEKSMKKMMVIFKKIQIEMDSLDYPSFDTISKLVEINRMMGDVPSEVMFFNQIRGEYNK